MADQTGRVRWRSYHRRFQLRTQARDARRRNQRRWGNRQFRPIRPCHDVGQAYILLQLDVGRGDDRLCSVVRLRRHRNDRLPREFRICLPRRSRVDASSVERRQVFRRLVVDHLGVLEGRTGRGLRMQLEKPGKRNEHNEREDVIPSRLHESAPGKATLHKHIGPERGGRGGQF